MSSVIIGGYEIDVAETLEPSFDNEVTEHPVEEGSEIVDHVRARPISLQVDGLISDTPIGALAARRQQFTLINGESFAFPSDEAFAFLTKVHEDREPITVETMRRTYTSMVLETLVFPEDARTGGALKFRASFRQVRLVTNARTTIRVAVPRASSKVNRGSKPATEVPFKTTEEMFAEKQVSINKAIGGAPSTTAPPPPPPFKTTEEIVKSNPWAAQGSAFQ